MKQAVVLVHGIWMHGSSMLLLARHLRRAGFDCHCFSYASIRVAPADNAQRLQQFVADLDADVVHFVGHSLGGLVLLHLFEIYPQQRPGRVMFLGTPARGSQVAKRSYHYPLMPTLLGKSTQRALLGDTPKWKPARDLGLIAGSRPLGVGRLLGLDAQHNDGTVSLQETRIAGATGHISLPVSHAGLLFSARVARQVVHFLNHGQFQPE